MGFVVPFRKTFVVPFRKTFVVPFRKHFTSAEGVGKVYFYALCPWHVLAFARCPWHVLTEITGTVLRIFLHGALTGATPAPFFPIAIKIA